MSTSDETWWSAFYENDWKLDPGPLAKPGPRTARRHVPPLTGSRRRLTFLVLAVLGVELLWALARVMSGASAYFAWVALGVTGTVALLLLALPRLLEARRAASSHVQRQLRLAEAGQVSTATVQSVEHEKTRARSGYRDGTVKNPGRGTARCVFTRSDGSEDDVYIPFAPPEEALREGDEVVVVVDAQGLEEGMAVLHMTDVQILEE